MTMAMYSPVGWKQITRAVAVFVAWTLTSFVCHESGKLFLQLPLKQLETSSTSNEANLYRFGLALLLTAVQCLTCLLMVRPIADGKSLFRSRSMTLLIFSHALATLATNYSMSYIEAASTQAIKLTEPILMAIAHHVIYQEAVPAQTVISIPMIICGALIFTSQKVQDFSNTTGILLAFASNVILAARNITLKKLQAGQAAATAVALKPNTHIVATLLTQAAIVAGLVYGERQNLISGNVWLPAALVLTSGIFHVAYSYISTNIILRLMNVVSHSIANIFKRFLVVLLLCAVSSRHITAVNILGLVMAAVGLAIYTHGKFHRDKHHTKQGEDKQGHPGSLRSNFLIGAATSLLFLVSVIGWFGPPSLINMAHPVESALSSELHKESRGLYDLERPFLDFSHILNDETDPEMREFLSWRLIDHPEDTDKRAKTLTNNKDIIEEAQRILVNILQDLLGKAKHVMLMEIATYENKGDPAITVGEVLLLRRMNVSIVFYCETYKCRTNESLSKAAEISKRYGKDELVILMQGGGNLVGYSFVDKIRKNIIDTFPDRRLILFSQSIWLTATNGDSLEYCRRVYSNKTNLVMFLRDRQSLEIARANFPGVKLILAPDMAFCIGMVPRQLPPIYDIVWLKRTDGESTGYKLPPFPPNLTVDVRDWWEWKSNKGNTDMEKSFLIAAGGFQFLQRGRIVITDRLHGHILSTLMNIPHVVVDNPPFFKLSSFGKSWTSSLSNVIRVSNGSLAMDAAQELLKNYEDSLPSVGPRDMYVGQNV